MGLLGVVFVGMLLLIGHPQIGEGALLLLLLISFVLGLRFIIFGESVIVAFLKVLKRLVQLLLTPLLTQFVAGFPQLI